MTRRMGTLDDDDDDDDDNDDVTRTRTWRNEDDDDDNDDDDDGDALSLLNNTYSLLLFRLVPAYNYFVILVFTC